MKPQKKISLLQNLQKKKELAHEFRGDNKYFGSLRLRTALQWHQACYFLWSTTLASWGAQAVIWGHGPELPPVESSLRQVYIKLLNSNYHIFVKEILFEIGFIEEMRTI